MRFVVFIAAVLTQPESPAPTSDESQAQPQVVQPYIEQPQDEAYMIGKLLRCPVCQGMPIAESPSTMATDMMRKVREMHAAGKSRQEIIDYFVSRYGEWVLLEPKSSGFNLLVWVLPPAALLLGIIIVLARLQSSKAGTPKPAPSEPTDDPYLRRVREEVQR